MKSFAVMLILWLFAEVWHWWTKPENDAFSDVLSDAGAKSTDQPTEEETTDTTSDVQPTGQNWPKVAQGEYLEWVNPKFHESK